MKIQNYAWFKMHYGSLPHCFKATISFRSIIVVISLTMTTSKSLSFEWITFWKSQREGEGKRGKSIPWIFKKIFAFVVSEWAVDGACYDHFYIASSRTYSICIIFRHCKWLLMLKLSLLCMSFTVLSVYISQSPAFDYMFNQNRPNLNSDFEWKCPHAHKLPRSRFQMVRKISSWEACVLWATWYMAAVKWVFRKMLFHIKICTVALYIARSCVHNKMP